ncbi:ornithine decarboxylase [Morganella psychrotolerans]|uniref:ornithine decarboxylase n=1 Tax=Morganella psychrotolerans TaxID=368603 RepID=A0A1B8HV14_9GAMM|nr:ornithine decarboxylase [Morganella psychrotolerans]OBU13599.1 ornithine decarboxylase [Morganella psychrotolerans]
MKNKKFAVSSLFSTAFGALLTDLTNMPCEVVSLAECDFTGVALCLITAEDIENGQFTRIEQQGFGQPVFVAQRKEDAVLTSLPQEIAGVINLNGDDNGTYLQMLLQAAQAYSDGLPPPFFGRMMNYTAQNMTSFACPGHQGGEFFRRHPAGRQFTDYFGDTIFRSDLCNADVALGDLLIHEGAACAAQQHAATVFNADKTYFVLNGTSSSNKVVLNALLTPGDLVLFDRNNHKSNHHGALIQAGATPVYLEAARNPFGLIGGIDARCFDEDYLRARIAEAAPGREKQARPFRLAVIQLGTYDGTVYNARQVVDSIGSLCDYILFDSAWVGYEQFIPMMQMCSPLLLELNENDPGILVTQSVHKQMAGFSQASQIHKKDRHIKGQARYVSHKQMNNAFMMHASTSPFYPLFAALDVNAKMHAGEHGKRLWAECVRTGIEARKLLLRTCQFIRPFIPEMVNGRPWADAETEVIAADRRFFNFIPGERWHGFDGYAEEQYFVDPCKLLLTTPGVDVCSGEYEAFGVPATILAYYLRENNIVAEKCDLNSILFLLTPAETTEKMQHLVRQIACFEQLLNTDAPLETVLPSLLRTYPGRYTGYTLRRLCQEMHDLFVRHNVKQRQKEMFRRTHFPAVRMSPKAAHTEFVRGNTERVAVTDIAGRIAAEGALPYPPGVLCVVPGEVWEAPVQHYFLALEETGDRFPGFAPELQGAYSERDEDGHLHVYAYVIHEKKENEL